MSNVVTLGNVTRLDLPAERVLEEAKSEVEKVVLIGWDKDGEFYFASSVADGPEVLWLLELAKKEFLEI